MRRRSVLAALGSSLAAVAGCVGDGDPDPGADSTPTRSGAQTAFRSALERNAEALETVSFEGTDWTVSYHADECCGDPLAAHQATLARNFSAVRPADVSLTVTTYHECTNIHWEIPADLARKHRAGEIDTDTYVRRVQNTTSQESQC